MAKIPSYLKNCFAVPVIDGNANKFFDPQAKKYSTAHLGIDISWWTEPHLPIIAAQSGTVVEVSSKPDATVGNFIVLQHDYEDGTHAWTAYIHLHETPGFYKRDANWKYIKDSKGNKQKTALKVGNTVNIGQEIGIKGNTGKSNGEHLHIYITKPTTAKYTWNTMRSNVIDPLTVLFRSKATKYLYLGSYLKDLPFIEDVKKPVVYPKPVDRNDTVKQVEVIMDVLRLRNGPGTNFDAYNELCKKGVYDIYEEKLDAEQRYLWYKIATIDNNEFWIASGGSRTKDLLPVESEVDILKRKVKYLEEDVQAYQLTIAGLNQELSEVKDAYTELENEKNLNDGELKLYKYKFDEIKKIVE